MSRVFNPHRAIYVPATGGHPKNAEYRVAWGVEQWDTPVNVTKVQMVYDGRVAGMLSPSYPDNTLDEMAVTFALKLLKDSRYGTNSKTIKDVLVLKKVASKNELDKTIESAENEIENMNMDIFDSKNNGVSVLVSVELKEQFELEDSIYAFLFRVEISPLRRS
jgi:hypothetical protein